MPSITGVPGVRKRDTLDLPGAGQEASGLGAPGGGNPRSAASPVQSSANRPGPSSIPSPCNLPAHPPQQARVDFTRRLWPSRLSLGPEGGASARGHMASYVSQAQRTRPSVPQGTQSRTRYLHMRMITLCTHSPTPRPAPQGAATRQVPPSKPLKGASLTCCAWERSWRLGEAKPHAVLTGRLGPSWSPFSTRRGAPRACAHTPVLQSQRRGTGSTGRQEGKGRGFLREEEGTREGPRHPGWGPCHQRQTGEP